MKKYFLLILFGVGIGVVWNMHSAIFSYLEHNPQTQQAVKGAKVNGTFAKDFSAIQQQIDKLPFANIASSSPEVQKILHDMQGLKKYPLGEAKAICETLCKSL